MQENNSVSSTKRKRGRPPKAFNMGDYLLDASADFSTSDHLQPSQHNTFKIQQNNFIPHFNTKDIDLHGDASGGDSSNNEAFEYDSDKDPGWTPQQIPMDPGGIIEEELDEVNLKKFKKSRLKLNMLGNKQNDVVIRHESTHKQSTHPNAVSSIVPLHPTIPQPSISHPGGGNNNGNSFTYPHHRNPSYIAPNANNNTYNYLNSMANKRKYNNEERHAFRKGAFLIAKQDVQKFPECAIWRVDGPCLLQKYEPITLNDQQKAFRKTLIFSGWANTTRKNYRSVQIQVLLQVCRTIELVSVTEVSAANLANASASALNEGSSHNSDETSNDGIISIASATTTNDDGREDPFALGLGLTPKPRSILASMTNDPDTDIASIPVATSARNLPPQIKSLGGGLEKNSQHTDLLHQANDSSIVNSTSTRSNPNDATSSDVTSHDYPSLRGYFDVYVQLLLSTAIHPAFVDMVQQDGDDYFIRPYNKIEGYTKAFLDAIMVCSNKRMWDENYFDLLKYFPSMEYGSVADLNDCYACNIKNNKTCKVTFFGHPYNYVTLQPIDNSLSSSDIPNQTIRLCPPCLEMSELYVGLYNVRHRLFHKCLAHVKILKQQNPNVAPTQLLESSLFNQSWKDMIFEDMLSMWDHAHLYCTKFKEFFPETAIQINKKDCQKPQLLEADMNAEVPPVSVLTPPHPLPNKEQAPIVETLVDGNHAPTLALDQTSHHHHIMAQLENPTHLTTTNFDNSSVVSSSSTQAPYYIPSSQPHDQSTVTTVVEGHDHHTLYQPIHEGGGDTSLNHLQTASVATLVQTPEGPKLLINNELRELNSCQNLIMCKDEQGNDVLYYLEPSGEDQHQLEQGLHQISTLDGGDQLQMVRTTTINYDTNVEPIVNINYGGNAVSQDAISHFINNNDHPLVDGDQGGGEQSTPPADYPIYQQPQQEQDHHQEHQHITEVMGNGGGHFDINQGSTSLPIIDIHAVGGDVSEVKMDSHLSHQSLPLTNESNGAIAIATSYPINTYSDIRQVDSDTPLQNETNSPKINDQHIIS